MTSVAESGSALHGRATDTGVKLEGRAVISDCGIYRYRLERHNLPGNGAGCVAWIMVNPSTADAAQDDPTIRRVINFSAREGFGWLIVGNVFALRATDVREVGRAADPHGPDNAHHLRAIMLEASKVIVAWGPVAKLPKLLRKRYQRVTRIADELGVPLYCLGTAQDGHPRHPLMLAGDTPLTEWPRRRLAAPPDVSPLSDTLGNSGRPTHD